MRRLILFWLQQIFRIERNWAWRVLRTSLSVPSISRSGKQLSQFAFCLPTNYWEHSQFEQNMALWNNKNDDGILPSKPLFLSEVYLGSFIVCFPHNLVHDKTINKRLRKFNRQAICTLLGIMIWRAANNQAAEELEQTLWERNEEWRQTIWYFNKTFSG